MKFPKWDSIDAHNYRQTGHRLLDKDEQIELAKQVERGVIARRRLENSRPKCSGTARCLNRQKTLAEQARQTLIIHNLRLVTYWAHRFHKREPSISLDDYVGEGRSILIGFVDRIGRHPKGYDWRRGAKLSTYLSNYLKLRLRSFMLDNRRLIRVPQPTNINPNANPDLKAEARRRIIFTNNPSVFEQTAEQRRDSCLDSDPVSILIEEEENKEEDDEKSRRWQLIMTTLKELLTDGGLDERDKEIFERSFGINGYPGGESERALAKRLGISKARIGQLRRRMILKIKNKILPSQSE